jgi:hypothetical protein
MKLGDIRKKADTKKAADFVLRVSKTRLNEL